MHLVSQEVTFSYGHRLLGYQGKCGRLHGHNGRVEVVLASRELDEQGFVVDFDEIDAALRSWLVENFDHRMLLHRDDPVIAHLEAAGEDFVALDENPTAEVIARRVFEHVRSLGAPVVEVRLWELETSCAIYRADADGAGR